MPTYNVTVKIEVEGTDEDHAVERVENFMLNVSALDIWDEDGNPINIWYYVSDQDVELLEDEE